LSLDFLKASTKIAIYDMDKSIAVVILIECLQSLL